MKCSVAILFTLLSSGLAFAPQQSGARVSTARDALFDSIIGMDLFDREKSKYGARSGKNLKDGKITSASYVPSGLTKAQYEKVRSQGKTQKDARYAKNVAKAGKFLGYDKFYLERGTDLNASWKKDVNLGHRMCKTKYDWSGKKISDNKEMDSDASKFGKVGKKVAGRKVAPKKAVKKFRNY